MNAPSPRSDPVGAPAAALYQRHAPTLFAWLRQRTSWEDAEDVLLEVFLAAFERDQLLAVPEAKQLAWLVSVAQHKLIDHYRRLNRHPAAALDEFAETLEEDEALAPEQVALRHERHAHLYAALQRLPGIQQRAVQLRFADGLHCKEIAAALGKRGGTVRVLLWRVSIASQGLPNIMPVVANGVIYFTASGAYAQNGVSGVYSLAYAFSAKDGKRLWRSQNFPIPLITPPAVANGRLYIGTTKGVYALKVSDGSLLWQYDAGGQVYAPLQVVDGVVYAGVFRKTASASGVMLALNASDASVRWQAPLAGYVGAYQQYAVLNGTLYVTAGGYAYALNTANGSTRWRSKYSAPLPLGGALTVAP